MQTVSNKFKRLSDADMRPLTHNTLVSFDKSYDEDVNFWVWDESEWDGGDVWAPVDDNPIQAWDKYAYASYGERLIYHAIKRELEFPYSVVSAIADFQLNNYDKYFTPNSTSPIDQYILPKRPVRLLQGFDGENIQLFVGLTEGMPELSRTAGTATFTAMDFLTWIYDMPIRNTEVMVNVTTDEVLANIFTQFGLLPSQYDLEKGRNKIPFLFFEKDQQTAGDVIRPLLQAEMGMLWLDEEGIIRFRPRLEDIDTPVMTLTSDHINELDTSEDDQIINHLIIRASVRVLQEPQSVYSISGANGNNFIIPAGASQPVNLELEDPSINIVQPTYGENSSISWFKAIRNDTEQEVTSDVTLTGVAEQTNSYTLFVSNANPFSITISDVLLWGEPAKVKGGKASIYEAYDDVSVGKFEEQILTIENNFIQSMAQADSLAETILDQYSEYNDVLIAEVKGTPALQLSDIVTVDYEEFQGQYRIIGIENTLQDAKYTQILTLRRYTPRSWWTWDVSIWDGDDVWAP